MKLFGLVALTMVGWLLESPAMAQWATDWQMCQGAKLAKFTGWDSVFAKASPPEIDAAEWRPCPKPRTIGWSIARPDLREASPASFHYFQTILMYPEKGRNCRLVVGGVEGGIEVTIVNAVHPLGKTLARFLDNRGKLAKGEAETLDLTPHLRPGFSRVIISHNDAGADQASLRFARIEIDDRAAVSDDISISVVKDVLTVHKRRVIYLSGGTDPEWEAKKEESEIKVKLFRERQADLEAARAEERRRKAQDRQYQSLATQGSTANQFVPNSMSNPSWSWYPRTTVTYRWVIRIR